MILTHQSSCTQSQEQGNQTQARKYNNTRTKGFQSKTGNNELKVETSEEKNKAKVFETESGNLSDTKFHRNESKVNKVLESLFKSSRQEQSDDGLCTFHIKCSGEVTMTICSYYSASSSCLRSRGTKTRLFVIFMNIVHQLSHQ